MEDIQKTLKELQIEDFIWIIFLFSSGFAIYSDKLERDSILFKDKNAKKAYKTINIAILSVGFFIYLYFLILAYNRLKSINPNTTMKEAIIKNARFVAAALIIIAAILSLLIEIFSDEDAGIDMLI